MVALFRHARVPYYWAASLGANRYLPDVRGILRTSFQGRLAEKVRTVITLLREEYPSSLRPTERHPTDSLIATILSQHTADRNSTAAFRTLQQRFPTWEEVAAAPLPELAASIRAAGLANIKAQHIQAALRSMQAEYGTMDLSLLRTLPLDEATVVLRNLPGVGPKTAACVLLFSCGLPALPVDTHVHRIARRLGFIPERASAEAAHDLLKALVAAEDTYDFHVKLVQHGRLVCHSQHPRCGHCVLYAHCAYGRGSQQG